MGKKRISNTLNPEIRVVRLRELKSFCEGELYKQFSTVPITPSRAASYLSNPDGKPEDVVLLLALIDRRLIAFRSLFAGVAYAENKEIRFGWCSGSWVDPEFRRQGLSQRLLKEAYNCWNGQLMLTNYSPETESLYLKTGGFKPVYQFEGVRGYLFPKAAKLFPNAKEKAVAKILFPGVDFFAAVTSNIRIAFYRYKKPDGLNFILLEHPDEECYKFMENYNEGYLFKRKAKEIKWILASPWVAEINRPYEKKYPFSASSEDFYYRTVKIMHRNNLNGVCLFSVRERHLKTLFFWGPSSLEADLAGFLKNYSVKNRLEMLTFYNQGIANPLIENKYPLLHVRKISQMVYSSFDTGTAASFIIQDGDGDRAFT